MTLARRALLCSGCALFFAVAPARGVGFENHRIVARRSVDVLPAPIAPLFEARRDAFEEWAVEPFAVWPRDSQTRRRRNWGWVGLDLGVTEQTRSARMKAAERFPRTRSRARQAYRKHHVRAGGVLPWAVADLYDELVDAFREGQEEDVIRAAGHLIHFAACCASPFDATCNRDGQLTGNLCLGERKIGDDGFAHQNAHYRFDLELVRRNGSRYQEKISLEPQHYDSAIEPAGRAFEVLLDSLGCLDEVLTADREILARLQASDAAGFAARADEYYVLLDERCGELCVERLRIGSILAGSLIGGAWEQAGRPSAEDIRTRGGVAPQPAEATDPRPDEKPAARSETTGGFVGSKNSKVFHRLDCPYAKRIRPENRVYFKTAEEALKQGRRPCRSCKPE